jgi:predicted RNase H-related nuclease YkuK (DUF458 family)
MKNEYESKALKEIHNIRERIYEETKNMTPAERVKHTKNEAKKIIEEYHLKIIYENRNVL